MTGLEKFRNSGVGTVLILTVICAVIAFALAGVYQVTEPLIAMGKLEGASQTQKEVLPQADRFALVDGIDLPEGITEAVKAVNGAGFVFRSEAAGFSGLVSFMIGIDADGMITGISMFEHNETPGLGTKVAEPDYLEQYYGAVDPAGVEAVSGATKSTNALKAAIAQAREAFELVSGVV